MIAINIQKYLFLRERADRRSNKGLFQKDISIAVSGMVWWLGNLGRPKKNKYYIIFRICRTERPGLLLHYYPFRRFVSQCNIVISYFCRRQQLKWGLLRLIEFWRTFCCHHHGRGYLCILHTTWFQSSLESLPW